MNDKRQRRKIRQVWYDMHKRCRRDPYYVNIKVCNEWNDFETFYNWAVNKYQEGLYLDRIDNLDGYKQSNCRFVSPKISALNRRMFKNNTQGVRGVYFERDRQRYRAYISIDYKTKHLGRFKTLKEAVIRRNQYIRENNLAYITDDIDKVEG